MANVCSNERRRLFSRINHVTFAINDILLYLDTHPKDAAALEYYQHMKELREHAVAEYETKYGPLTIFGEKDCNYWQWAVSPWPWERGYY